MSGYFEFRKNLTGYSDVSDTIKAIEQIAASDIHRLRESTHRMKLYADELETSLSRLVGFKGLPSHALLRPGHGGKSGLLVLGGYKGLVGEQYHDLVNSLVERKDDYDRIFVVGNKIRRFIDEENIPYETVRINDGGDMKPDGIDILSDTVFTEYRSGRYSRFDILYASFSDLMNQEPVFLDFLPFSFSKKGASDAPEGLPIFEPSFKSVFSELLNLYISMAFRKVVDEARLSELSARMVSMEHASGKIDDMMKKLRHAYNKERRRVATLRQTESFVAHKML